MLRISLAVPIILLGAVAHSTDSPRSWPSLHNGGNTSTELEGLPIEWSPEKGVAWSISLPGYGQSAPIVWKDRIYLTAVEGDEKERCLVLACDAATGGVLWTKQFPASVRQKTSYMVSRAAPTPVVDADGLYVLFESGDLLALTHEGSERWRVALFDDKERVFQNSHGYGASPAQTDEAVVVLVDHRGPSYLLAINKRTGKPLWKTERPPRSSWSSPRVTKVDGMFQIIVSSSGTADGYDARTGRQLWSHEGISGNSISSAAVSGNLVYVGASVSRRESDAEKAATSNCCLQIIPGSPKGYKLLWQAKKAVCHYVSPLVHRGYVYYVNNVGVLYCLDAETGEQVYVHRIDGPSWAQPIAAGEHIYLFGKSGVTTVVRAGPEFEWLASNRLWNDNVPPVPKRSYTYEPQGESDTRSANPRDEYLDPIVYGVAAVDGAFYVRLGTHLYCIRASAADKGEGR